MVSPMAEAAVTLKTTRQVRVWEKDLRFWWDIMLKWVKMGEMERWKLDFIEDVGLSLFCWWKNCCVREFVVARKEGMEYVNRDN